MSDAPDSAPYAPAPPAPEPTAAVVPDVDETAVLDEFEADLAAVETAIATIDRIAGESVGGEQAAAEIRAAVSVDRFGATASGSGPHGDTPASPV